MYFLAFLIAVGLGQYAADNTVSRGPGLIVFAGSLLVMSGLIGWLMGTDSEDSKSED